MRSQSQIASGDAKQKVGDNMRFCCDSCQTWYQSSRSAPCGTERTVVVKCKKCGASIAVAAEVEGAVPVAAAEGDEWYLREDGWQEVENASEWPVVIDLDAADEVDAEADDDDSEQGRSATERVTEAAQAAVAAAEVAVPAQVVAATVPEVSLPSSVTAKTPNPFAEVQGVVAPTGTAVERRPIHVAPVPVGARPPQPLRAAAARTAARAALAQPVPARGSSGVRTLARVGLGLGVAAAALVAVTVARAPHELAQTKPAAAVIVASSAPSAAPAAPATAPPLPAATVVPPAPTSAVAAELAQPPAESRPESVASHPAKEGAHKVSAKPAEEHAPKVAELKAPEPVVEAKEAAGAGLESDDIEAGFTRIRAAVKMCARAEERRNPEAHLATATLAVTVGPGGEVVNLAVAGAAADSELGQCIRDAVKRVAFAKFDGKPQTIKRSFDMGR